MVLGIDLGTCNTLAATISRDDYPVLIPDHSFKENMITPSVAFIEDSRALIGLFAESHLDLYPNKNYIRFFKRYFGTNQPVFLDNIGRPWFSETIAAMMLKKIRFDAEIALMEQLDSLVITVPAHYNDSQRKSVIEAAKLADISLSAIIEEPVAAAISYSNSYNANDEIILVYDFGGGTFDLTIITKSGNNLFVLAKDGIPNLGGKEFDDVIAQRIMDDYQEAFGSTLDMSPAVANHLRKISEGIKLKLSTDPEMAVTKWLSFGRSAFEFCLSCDDFYINVEKLVKKTEEVINRCLRSIGLEFGNLNKILLVGGTSKVPFIQKYWHNRIDPAKQQVIFYEPMNSVSYGAAIYANTLVTKSGKINVPIELKTVSTYNIAIEDKNRDNHSAYDIMIHKNSPLPVNAKRIFQVDLQRIDELRINLCQFWDKEEVFQIGSIRSVFEKGYGVIHVELTVENRANGTIGIKLRNADNGRDIKFDFEKINSEYKYDYEAQRTNLENVLINNIY